MFVSNPEDFDLLGQTCGALTLCPVEGVLAVSTVRGWRVLHSVSTVLLGLAALLELQSFKDCFFPGAFGEEGSLYKARWNNVFKFSSVLGFCCFLQK